MLKKLPTINPCRAGTMPLEIFLAVHTPCSAWSICSTVEACMRVPQHGKIKSSPCTLLGALLVALLQNFLQTTFTRLPSPLVNKSRDACRVVSGAVRTRALQAEPIGDPAILADVQHTSAFLAALFAGICTGNPPHPALATSVAQCVGDYATWFGRVPNAPLQAALQQLLAFMAVPQAAQSAATAFRNLCVRCGSQLCSPADLTPLIHAARAALSAPGMFFQRACGCGIYMNVPQQEHAFLCPRTFKFKLWSRRICLLCWIAGSQVEQEWQKLMVEGLARVVILLPASEAAAAGLQIAQAIVERITQIISQASGEEPPGGSLFGPST